MNPIQEPVCTHKQPSPKTSTHLIFATTHMKKKQLTNEWTNERTNEAKRRHFKRFISSSAATINRSTFIHRNHCLYVCVCGRVREREWEREKGAKMSRWRRSPMFIQDLLFFGAAYSGLNAIPMLNFSFSVWDSAFVNWVRGIFLLFVMFAFQSIDLMCMCVLNIRILSVIEMKDVCSFICCSYIWKCSMFFERLSLSMTATFYALSHNIQLNRTQNTDLVCCSLNVL